MFYYLLTLNVFYKKKRQFNFHQFLKYTIYNLKKMINIWEVMAPPTP